MFFLIKILLIDINIIFISDNDKNMIWNRKKFFFYYSQV